MARLVVGHQVRLIPAKAEDPGEVRRLVFGLVALGELVRRGLPLASLDPDEVVRPDVAEVHRLHIDGDLRPLRFRGCRAGGGMKLGVERFDEGSVRDDSLGPELVAEVVRDALLLPGRHRRADEPQSLRPLLPHAGAAGGRAASSARGSTT